MVSELPMLPLVVLVAVLVVVAVEEGVTVVIGKEMLFGCVCGGQRVSPSMLLKIASLSEGASSGSEVHLFLENGARIPVKREEGPLLSWEDVNENLLNAETAGAKKEEVEVGVDDEEVEGDEEEEIEAVGAFLV